MRDVPPVGRLALLPALSARDAVKASLSSLLPARYTIRPGALDEAVAWLCLTHDVTGRRGCSKGFSLLFGWQPAFPETTGYIIGTLLGYSRLTADEAYATRAQEMGDWELEVQSENGGIVRGLLDGTARAPEAFNTGMVMHGWLDLHGRSGEERHLEAAQRGGHFLLAAQDDDGAWRGEHSYNGIPHTYCSRVSWALLRLAEATREKAFGDAARKNLDWVLRMQRENGWFDACAFDRDSLPNTHAIAYTLRGLAESFALTGDQRYLQAVVLTAEALMRKLEVIGTLPATFTPSWTPAARYVCLTGLVQLGGVFLRLFQITSDARYLNAGLKAVDQAAARQESIASLPVRGALAGSFPIYGRYAPLQWPNWATKFLADGLMLRDECMGST